MKQIKKQHILEAIEAAERPSENAVRYKEKDFGEINNYCEHFGASRPVCVETTRFSRSRWHRLMELCWNTVD